MKIEDVRKGTKCRIQFGFDSIKVKILWNDPINRKFEFRELYFGFLPFGISAILPYDDYYTENFESINS